MKILVGIWHPAHVHTFRNAIKELKKKGHEVKVVAIEKDITIELLNLYGIEYEIIGKSGTNKFSNLFKLVCSLEITYNLWKISKKFQADILLGRVYIGMAQVSKLLNIPFISFFDTDLKPGKIAKIKRWIPRRYDLIFTPANFNRIIDDRRDVKMHIELPSYKELAYLHPNNFEQNSESLREYGIDPDERYSIIRFVRREAWHDTNLYGIDEKSRTKLVEILKENGEVYISSESKLPKELDKHRLDIPVDKIHHLIYYADLFVGEGGTMPTEAALLGTPAIRFSTLAGEDDLSNFKELEDNYSLLHNYSDQEKVISKATELIQNRDSKRIWRTRRKKLLSEKIDLNAFLVDFIDHYPNSVERLKDNNEKYLEGYFE